MGNKYQTSRCFSALYDRGVSDVVSDDNTYLITVVFLKGRCNTATKLKKNLPLSPALSGCGGRLLWGIGVLIWRLARVATP